MNTYPIMPCIIKETSEGTARYTIQDELFQRREIMCVGEITQASASALIMQLRYLHQADPEKEITMYISSPGGEVSSGLAIYDVMTAIRCPVRTVCINAASMAAVLFIAGNKRDIFAHSTVMIHDPLIAGGVGGSALKIDSVARNIMKTRETMAAIIAKHSGRTLEEVYEKTQTDTYFHAEEAVAWGLADNIIHEL